PQPEPEQPEEGEHTMSGKPRQRKTKQAEPKQEQQPDPDVYDPNAKPTSDQSKAFGLVVDQRLISLGIEPGPDTRKRLI
ncbi:hypothetical protein R0K05_25035, partial [Planococcus sp. SIMBA_160]